MVPARDGASPQQVPEGREHCSLAASPSSAASRRMGSTTSSMRLEGGPEKPASAHTAAFCCMPSIVVAFNHPLKIHNSFPCSSWQYRHHFLLFWVTVNCEHRNESISQPAQTSVLCKRTHCVPTNSAWCQEEEHCEAHTAQSPLPSTTICARGASYVSSTLVLTTCSLGSSTRKKNGSGCCLRDTVVPSKLLIPSNEDNSPNNGNAVINMQQIYVHILSCSNSI